jgi:predicted phosphate transport protein (TIGR00153 family)
LGLKTLVLPVEAEPRAKRRALNLCQDHLRKVVEVARRTMQMIDAFVSNDRSSATHLYEEIQRLSDEVMDSKRVVTQELVEIGAILFNREDFLRFTYTASEIAELYKGVSFRVLAMVERKWDLPQTIKRGIVELSEAVFNAVIKLREAVLTLSYGSPQISEKARDVEVAEKQVDNLYRSLEILLLEQNINLSTMLLARDIIQLLEDTADKIEDVSDAVRILALAI